jgi:predicted phosphodiesterase
MKRLLIVGDLHVGKKQAIMPDEVYIDTEELERTITASPLQNRIFGKWEEMVDEVGKVDAVLCMGDICDGFNYRSHGTGLWTSDINLQVTVATELLSMIKTNKYIGVQGSFYHVGDNMSSDRAVMESFAGVFADELSVNIGECRVHASHFVGVSSSGSAYRTTPIAREMMLASINSDDYGKFDLIVRGHAHYFVQVNFTRSKGIICPCWCGRDEFVARQTLAFNPHLGYVLVNVDGNDLSVDPHVFTLKNKELIKEVKV